MPKPHGAIVNPHATTAPPKRAAYRAPCMAGQGRRPYARRRCSTLASAPVGQAVLYLTVVVVYLYSASNKMCGVGAILNKIFIYLLVKVKGK